MEQIYITDTGQQMIAKINDNFSGTTPHSADDCRTRFIAEMNTKAQLLGMSDTIFYDPAGNQPATYAAAGSWPELWITEDSNVMTPVDAIRMVIYASGFKIINDVWNMQSFTLKIIRNGAEITETINSGIFNNSTYQSSINALLGDYEILGAKTGTYDFAPLNTNGLVGVFRSKLTGKVYAVIDFNTASTTSTSNRYIDTKKMLDYVDNNQTMPSFNKGGAEVVELTQYTPSLLNRAILSSLFAYNSSYVGYPASMSKVMTAILFAESGIDINKYVEVKERDRQKPSGYDLLAGDVLRVQDVLRLALMNSSNTSAQILARIVGNKLLNDDEIII